MCELSKAQRRGVLTPQPFGRGILTMARSWLASRPKRSCRKHSRSPSASSPSFSPRTATAPSPVAGFLVPGFDLPICWHSDCYPFHMGQPPNRTVDKSVLERPEEAGDDDYAPALRRSRQRGARRVPRMGASRSRCPGRVPHHAVVGRGDGSEAAAERRLMFTSPPSRKGRLW
jgi:hypothetical protein